MDFTAEDREVSEGYQTFEKTRIRAKEGFNFGEATFPALPLEVNLTKVCHEESTLHVRFAIRCERQGPHNAVSHMEIWVAILDGGKIGKEIIGFFVSIRHIDWMGFGMPPNRKGVAQFRRVKAQVNVRLDGKDFNLRHVDCSVVNIRQR